jgi:hypothetical protein
MTIDEARAHVGDGVIYRPPGGGYDSAEEGTITSVNDRWVFVRYGRSRTSAATDPADLILLSPLRARRREFRASLRNGGSDE